MRELGVMIPLVDDSIREPLESFSVAISLSCNQSGVLLGQSLTTIVINDDDSKYCADYSLVPIFLYSVQSHGAWNLLASFPSNLQLGISSYITMHESN